MLQIKHQVPGRVRFRIQPRSPRLQRAVPGESVAERGRSPRDQRTWMHGLVSALRLEPGVQGVRLNAACASLVVHYDARVVTPEQLRAAVNIRAYAPRAGGATRAGTQRLLGRLRLGRARRTGPAQSGRRNRRMGGCGFCRLQSRLIHWLLRSTLRCWWTQWWTQSRRLGPRRHLTPPRGGPAGRRQGVGAAQWRPLFPLPDAVSPMPRPLLERLREHLGGGVTGHPVLPVPPSLPGR